MKEKVHKRILFKLLKYRFFFLSGKKLHSVFCLSE